MSKLTHQEYRALLREHDGKPVTCRRGGYSVSFWFPGVLECLEDAGHYFVRSHHGTASGNVMFYVHDVVDHRLEPGKPLALTLR